MCWCKELLGPFKTQQNHNQVNLCLNANAYKMHDSNRSEYWINNLAISLHVYASKSINIIREMGEIIEHYICFSVHLHNRLDWRTNTHTRKGWADYFEEAQILLPVCGSESNLQCCCLLGNSISATDASRINKLIHKAGTISGQNKDTFESVRNRRSLNKLVSIVDNLSHPLYDTLQGQWSSFSNRLILYSH